MSNDKDLKEAIKQGLSEFFSSDDYKVERKEVIMNAFEDWLDKQFTKFGKWTGRGVVSMVIVGLIYLFAKAKGLI